MWLETYLIGLMCRWHPFRSTGSPLHSTLRPISSFHSIMQGYEQVEKYEEKREA